jgi:UDP-N-acetylmuramate--alanine ligase
LLDIYPANEKPIEGITAEALAIRIAGAGKPGVAYAPSFAEAVASVAALARPGDMVLTLGAGSVSQLGAMLLEKLSAV